MSKISKPKQKPIKRDSYYETATGRWKEKLGPSFVHRAPEHWQMSGSVREVKSLCLILMPVLNTALNPAKVAGTLVTGLPMPRCAPSGHASCSGGAELLPLEKPLSRRGRRWNRTTQKLQTFFLTRSLSQGSRERMAGSPAGPVKLHFVFLPSALADHQGVWSRREGGAR